MCVVKREPQESVETKARTKQRLLMISPGADPHMPRRFIVRHTANEVSRRPLVALASWLVRR
jgi:hypothetical protein